MGSLYCFCPWGAHSHLAFLRSPSAVTSPLQPPGDKPWNTPRTGLVPANFQGPAFMVAGPDLLSWNRPVNPASPSKGQQQWGERIRKAVKSDYIYQTNNTERSADSAMPHCLPRYSETYDLDRLSLTPEEDLLGTRWRYDLGQNVFICAVDAFE